MNMISKGNCIRLVVGLENHDKMSAKSHIKHAVNVAS